MTGLTLQSLRRAHELKAISRQVVAPGGEALAKARGDELEHLQITVSGTTYDVFVLGAHDPDDAITARWIP